MFTDKMQKISAGLLMYRMRNNKLELFLVHPGGPYWKNKDSEVWGIPKGEIEDGENLLETAKREFEEETGIKPSGDFIPLGQVEQRSGKIVHAWAFEKDWSGTLKSNTIKIIWNRRKIEIPEVDKGDYFSFEGAKKKINPAQFEFIERLVKSIIL